MTEDDADVTFVTEYFHPEQASTAQLMTELTTELTDAFDMSVVTSLPSYHRDDRDSNVASRTVREGVAVERVRATRFDKDWLPGRVLNWLSFTLLALVRLLRSHRDDDLFVVLSNPPVLPLAAAVTKRLCGVPYVHLVHDIYPDMAVGLGYIDADGYVARAWQAVMRWIYADADRIVVLGDAMKHRLEAHMSENPEFDPGKIEVVHNWEDGDRIRPVPKSENEFAEEHGTRDRFTVVYSGNIGRFHDLETAIEAVQMLEERGRDRVKLLIIGEGARKERLRERVRDSETTAVEFLPFQPVEVLPESLTCGDVSLVGIKSEIAGTCVSSKLYSALAAGMPILAVVDGTDEVAHVVRSSDCGVHVSPGDAERAADAIERWMDDPELVARQGERARQRFENQYELEHAVSSYTRTIHDTLSS